LFGSFPKKGTKEFQSYDTTIDFVGSNANTREKHSFTKKRSLILSSDSKPTKNKYTIVASQLSTTISFLFPLLDGQTQLAC
jgi:hypothetical protein